MIPASIDSPAYLRSHRYCCPFATVSVFWLNGHTYRKYWLLYSQLPVPSPHRQRKKCQYQRHFRHPMLTMHLCSIPHSSSAFVSSSYSSSSIRIYFMATEIAMSATCKRKWITVKPQQAKTNYEQHFWFLLMYSAVYTLHVGHKNAENRLKFVVYFRNCSWNTLTPVRPSETVNLWAVCLVSTLSAYTRSALIWHDFHKQCAECIYFFLIAVYPLRLYECS